MAKKKKKKEEELMKEEITDEKEATEEKAGKYATHVVALGEGKDEGFKCHLCGKKFKSRGALQLHLFQAHGFKKEDKDAVDPTKGSYRITALTKGFRLDAQTLALAQLLIKMGVAYNLSDLFEKAIYRMAMGEGVPSKGGGNMSNPKEALTEIQTAEMIDAYINKLRKDKDVSDDELEKLEKQMARQLRLKQLERLIKGGDFDFKDFFILQMLQQNFKGSDSSLKAEIESLKQQLQQQVMINNLIQQFEKRIEDMKKNNGSDIQQFLLALEKIRAESEKKQKEIEKELFKEKERRLEERQKKFEKEVMEQVQSQLNSSGLDKELSERIKKQILDNLDLGKIFSGNKGEKNSAEVAKDLINGVVERIKEPLLKPLGQGLAARLANVQSQPVEVQPQPVQYVEGNPAPEASNPVIEEQPIVSHEQPDNNPLNIEVVGGEGSGHSN